MSDKASNDLLMQLMVELRKSNKRMEDEIKKINSEMQILERGMKDNTIKMNRKMYDLGKKIDTRSSGTRSSGSVDFMPSLCAPQPKPVFSSAPPATAQPMFEDLSQQEEGAAPYTLDATDMLSCCSSISHELSHEPGSLQEIMGHFDQSELNLYFGSKV